MRRLLILIGLMCYQLSASAANLLAVYQDALASDPIYQQAISQRLATKEGVPISLSALLPSLVMTLNPMIMRSGYSGANTAEIGFTPRNNTLRYYELALTASQTVFNYSQFVAVAEQMAISKSADATLNAALQQLIIRVANAYFSILRDQDNVHYNEAAQSAYAAQLKQAKQLYRAGLKTLTDVYTAQASYDSATANLIAAQTTLMNDRENLRVMTGRDYTQLAYLSDDFPLTTPKPAHMEIWVERAQQQNWNIKAARYIAESAKQNIKQQYGGHLPTVTVQGQWDRQYFRNINGYVNLAQRNGPTTQADRQLMFNINVPILAGGAVIAETNQATYQYQTTQQQLEQTIRDTLNMTRQSYLNVVSGISQVNADKQAVKSSISSLHGLKATYAAGMGTLVDVLNQQQKVFQTQMQYATDRYAFIMNALTLKQASGTLSFDDLRVISSWLREKRNEHRGEPT